MAKKKLSKSVRLGIWGVITSIGTAVVGFSAIQVFNYYNVNPLWGLALSSGVVIVGSVAMYRINRGK